jgi:hypothetical protein
MKEKVIADPTVAGWEYDSASGYWMWSAEGGSIQDGNTEGQITTWSGAEWTPEDAVVVDASGDITVNGTITVPPEGVLPRPDFISAGLRGRGVQLGSAEANGRNHTVGTISAPDTSGSTRLSFRVGGNTEAEEKISIYPSGDTTFIGNAVFRGNTSANGIATTTSGTQAEIQMGTLTGGTGRRGFLGYSRDSGVFTYSNEEAGTVTTHLTIDLSGNATFSGTVDAADFTVNGTPIGGGGLPDGDFTHNGKITATDFIATSDERLKDNITPMPVGLIDDIKPVQWDWKDGSGKSAGVVAQQLQAIGLDDYVVEGDDGQLGVNYQALTAILLAEVISLKAEVEALK